MSSMIAFWLCGLHITLEFFDSQKTHVSYTFFLFRIQDYWHNFQWSGMSLLWKTLTFYLQDVMSCLWCIKILKSIIFANLHNIQICFSDFCSQDLYQHVFTGSFQNLLLFFSPENKNNLKKALLVWCYQQCTTWSTFMEFFATNILKLIPHWTRLSKTFPSLIKFHS